MAKISLNDLHVHVQRYQKRCAGVAEVVEADISQTVLSGMFNMIMIVDISLSRFAQLEEELAAVGTQLGLQIRIQRSEIFDAMHRI